VEFRRYAGGARVGSAWETPWRHCGASARLEGGCGAAEKRDHGGVGLCSGAEVVGSGTGVWGGARVEEGRGPPAREDDAGPSAERKRWRRDDVAAAA